MSLQNLQAEVASLRLERDAYRMKHGIARADIAKLEAQLDEARDEVADLRHALHHASVTKSGQNLPQSKLQVAVTRLSSDTVQIQDNTAQIKPESDDEIEYIGSPKSVRRSEDTAKVALIRSTVLPAVDNILSSRSKNISYIDAQPQKYSIKHHRGPSEVGGTPSVDSSGPSIKRRRVEDASVASFATTSRHGIIKTTHSSTDNFSTSINSSINPKVGLPSNGAIAKSTSSRTTSSTSQEASVASSSKIELSAFPSSVSRSPCQSKVEIKPHVKEEAFILPQSLVSEYLATCKPFHIIPPPSSLYVSRKFIRHVYGGSDQHFLQFIPPSHNPSAEKKRRMAFPTFNMNPSMPSAPGEPGLLYASRHEILEDPPWTLFHRNPKTRKAVWCYLGEYKSELCGQMNAELFKSQQLVVKQCWGKSIVKIKKWDSYVEMRARIAMRKAGMSLTDENIQDEMKNIRCNNGLPVTVGDIISAFECGEETVDIIKVECVSYDRIFVEDMEANFRAWNSGARGITRTNSIGKEQSKLEGKGRNCTEQKNTSAENIYDSSQISQLQDGGPIRNSSLKGSKSRQNMRNSTQLAVWEDTDAESGDSGSSSNSPSLRLVNDTSDEDYI